MKVNYLHRHQFIEDLLKRYSNKDEDSSILLWEQIAEEIITVIGEEGFYTLYERSEYLTQKTYPWLVVTDAQSKQANERFSLLRM